MMDWTHEAQILETKNPWYGGKKWNEFPEGEIEITKETTFKGYQKEIEIKIESEIEIKEKSRKTKNWY